MLVPILLVTVLGAVSGVVLSVAGKYLAVPANEQINEVLAMLPGINCGACGFAGCSAYAKNIIEQAAPSNLCTPGGDDTAVKISEALGLPVLEVTEKVAQVHCVGNCYHSSFIMEYGGKPTCVDCNSYFEGRHSCSYACLGYGDCVSVCDYGAISLVNNVAVIDRSRCTGCSKCVLECPNFLITLETLTSEVFVGCRSSDRGGFVRKICDIGCIGCLKCQKTCKFEAITVTNNLAKIDASKCTNCGDCVSVCPTHVIQDYRIPATPSDDQVEEVIIA